MKWITKWRGLAVITVVAVMAALVLMKRGAASPEPAKQQAPVTMSVNVATPVKREWPVLLTASGSIVAWQEAIIGAETGGLRITALHVDVGSKVKRGQLLAELSRDSVLAEVRRYEALLASAKASLAQAAADADRARKVQKSGAISEQKINEYLATEKTAAANVAVAEAQLAVQQVTLSQTRIVAVDDGVITSRSALLGQVISVGTELFRLQRQARLEWQAEVDADQLARITTGAKAEIKLPSGDVIQGAVRLSTPTLSTSTSRANVFVSLPDGTLAKAGMFASGTIEAGNHVVLAVPEAALVLRDGHSYVFEVGADSKVSRRAIVTGTHAEGLAEVSSGLSENASVVIMGGAFLSDGDLVKVVKE